MKATVHPCPDSDCDTFTVKPLHLSVTRKYRLGSESNTHVVANADLLDTAETKSVIQSAKGGALLLACAIDEDHDEVLVSSGPDADAVEMLTRGIEMLTLALAAVRTTQS